MSRLSTNVFPDGDEQYDFLFKIVLVGDPGVGKTCVVQRYKHGVFTERQANTIGVDFTLKTIDIDGKRIKVCTDRVHCVFEDGTVIQHL